MHCLAVNRAKTRRVELEESATRQDPVQPGRVVLIGDRSNHPKIASDRLGDQRPFWLENSLRSQDDELNEQHRSGSGAQE